MSGKDFKQHANHNNRPNGKGRYALHVDLDGAEHVYRAHGIEYPFQDDQLFETGLKNALKFFSEMEIRATLFVIGEDLHSSRKTEILKEAVFQGHEIASHSLTHQKLTTLTREQRRREIFESRELISTKLGVTVEGFRAPGFDINREILELIDEAGYKYDSSVFPSTNFAKKLGVPSVQLSPHHPLTGRPLIEMPLPRHTPLPLPFHICYSLVLGPWYFRLGLKMLKEAKAPFVLLFHLTDLAAPLPNPPVKKWKAKLFTLSFLSQAEKQRRCQLMLESLKKTYTFVKTGELLRSVKIS